MSEMEIIGIYDDSYPDSALRRMIYTVELGKGMFVDIMVSEESRVVYVMQNEDGSTVYGSKNTCPGCVYDEEKAKNLAVAAYEKEYGKIN